VMNSGAWRASAPFLLPLREKAARWAGLGGTATMRLRPFPPRPRARILTLELQPRSAYVLRGEARWGWQHSIAPTPELRYSVTFRSRSYKTPSATSRR
jgi:hypothetical protein